MQFFDLVCILHYVKGKCKRSGLLTLVLWFSIKFLIRSDFELGRYTGLPLVALSQSQSATVFRPTKWCFGQDFRIDYSSAEAELQ